MKGVVVELRGNVLVILLPTLFGECVPQRKNEWGMQISSFPIP